VDSQTPAAQVNRGVMGVAVPAQIDPLKFNVRLGRGLPVLESPHVV
jgi:hypothetical protein